MSNKLLVRLKPYDKRRGQLLRSYSYAGIKFTAERGWFRVDKDIANYLEGVLQQETVPNSAYAFDVCTEEQAKDIDAREAASARRLRPALAEEANDAMTERDERRRRIQEPRPRRPRSADAGTLTTADLPPPADEGTHSPSFDEEDSTFREDMSEPDAPPDPDEPEEAVEVGDVDTGEGGGGDATEETTGEAPEPETATPVEETKPARRSGRRS